MLTLLLMLLADDPAVRSLSPDVTVELFAEDPQVVTPTGCDVAADGTLLVAESNTHFEPAGYDRHPSDRLLAWPGGRPGEPVVFADGLRRTMSLLVRPSWVPAVITGDLTGKGVQVYAATRSEIWLLEDRDGDWVADARELLVRHDTKGDYPHNGLAGLAFHPSGRLVFGQGENLGEPYEVVGRDGSKHAGGGEGGNVYLCDADGSDVDLFATGYWNPYASAVDALGNVFTVDNDPDSRPPCRLIHTVRGGDYGYRFGNGRKGTHPLTAWDGELPGTLPMMAGTGEAPSGILHWDRSRLFDEEESLLVTSWGDHRVDAYALSPRGSSYAATAKPLVVGGQDFRPVAIAGGPGGVAYVTDWVSRSYPVHGEGRVWKLTFADANGGTPQAMADAATKESGLAFARKNAETRAGFAAGLWKAARSGEMLTAGLVELDNTANSAGPWLQGTDTAALAGLSETGAVPAVVAELWIARFESGPDYMTPTQRSRAAARLAGMDDAAMRPADLDQAARLVSMGSQPFDPFVFSAWSDALARNVPPDDLREGFKRFAGNPWMLQTLTLALERQGHLTDADLRAAFDSGDATRILTGLRAVADANRVALKGDVESVARNAASRKTLLAALAVLHDLGGQPPAAFERSAPSAFAGELVLDGGVPERTRAIALSLIPTDDPFLTSERLREWTARGNADLRAVAARHVRDRKDRDLAAELAVGDATADIRVPAVDALSPDADGPLLRRLAADPDRDVAAAAFRSLRWAGEDIEAVPAPDAALAGESIFFHPQGPACGRCHRHGGRGGDVGPDLTHAGRSMDRTALLRAITHPSEHVAPQWTPWLLLLTDGRVETGLIHKDNDRTVELVRTDGSRSVIEKSDIAEQQIAEQSVMPERLHEKLSARQMKALLTFLAGGR